MKTIWRHLRGAYDKHWLHAYCLQAAAYFGGVYVQRGQDHRGWEWLGWASWGVSLVLIFTVTSRLRKAKCTKLHAQIIEEQRSKAMWS